jgi:hypothetical protein
MKVSPEKVRRFLILFGLAWTACLVLTGCASVDALFTTAEAIVSGIGLVIVALGAVVPAPIAAAINAAVEIAGNALAAVKTAYDNYKADPTNGSLLTDVENALASAKGSLPGLLSSLGTYVNSTLSTWIQNLVNALTDAFDAVAQDIQPAATKFVSEGSISKAEVSAVNQRAQEINNALKSAYEASLTAFPQDVQQKALSDFKHKTERYVGPIHI